MGVGKTSGRWKKGACGKSFRSCREALDEGGGVSQDLRLNPAIDTDGELETREGWSGWQKSVREDDEGDAEAGRGGHHCTVVTNTAIHRKKHHNVY